jgi:hypothetical protein
MMCLDKVHENRQAQSGTVFNKTLENMSIDRFDKLA